MRRAWGPMSLALFSVSTGALAQGSATVEPVRAADGRKPENVAAARALFEDARHLMDEERFDEACPKLEQASQLDPNGNGIKFNLAACYERTGRPASAWGLFSEVASLERLAGRSEREALAQSRAESVAPRVPHLTIAVPSRTNGLEVRRDGRIVEAPLFDTMLPIDPGEHRLSASAAAFAPWSKAISVSEGGAYVVEIPELSPLVAVGPFPSPSPPTADKGLRVGQITAIVMAGAGAATLATGGFFGWRALHLRDEASSSCASDGCDPRGYATRSDSITAGNISTALFVSGGVLLAVSAVLWFTAPRPARRARSSATQ